MSKGFGLIGTVTHDFISSDSGQSFEGLGGVLYQAAVLCGLGKEVFLYTNLGEELVKDVERMTRDWTTLHKEGIRPVPGPGNQVYLHYPGQGERVEVLKSVVPPLDSRRLLKKITEFGMLVMIVNSGFDLELSEWRKIVRAASCPVWLDIHSLLLSRELNVRRKYLTLAERIDWIKGVSFVQANAKEVATMLGQPDRVLSEADISRFASMALRSGAKAVFVTLGREGVFVLTSEESKKIEASRTENVVDTTGCGDVFCAAAAAKLSEGEDPFASALFGLELAAQAVSVRGIEESYSLASRDRK
jgi:sugar/nucleoside kinase (ribokinase family)